MAQQRFYVKVPYEERKIIKGYNARWDDIRKQWYLTDADTARLVFEKYPQYNTGYANGIGFTGFEWDFGGKYADIFDEMLVNAQRIIREEYEENRQIEELALEDGEITLEEREYAKPFDADDFTEEINQLAYHMMCRAAEIPVEPILVCKDNPMSLAMVDKDKVKAEFEEKYGFKIKKVGEPREANISDIFNQENFDGLKLILNKQYFKAMVELHKNSNYSCKNCSMVLGKNPEVTCTRGERFWRSISRITDKPLEQNAFSKPYSIFAPNFSEFTDKDKLLEMIDYKYNNIYGSAFFRRDKKQEQEEETAELLAQLEETGTASMVIDFSLISVYDIQQTFGCKFSELDDDFKQSIKDYIAKQSEKNDDKRYNKKVHDKMEKQAEGEQPVYKRAHEKLLDDLELPDIDFADACDILDIVAQEKGCKGDFICPIVPTDNDLDADMFMQKVYKYCAEILTDMPTSVLGIKSFSSSDLQLDLETVIAAANICEKFGITDYTDIANERTFYLLGAKSNLEHMQEGDASYMQRTCFVCGKGRMETFADAFDRADKLSKDIMSKFIEHYDKFKEQNKAKTIARKPIEKE